MPFLRTLIDGYHNVLLRHRNQQFLDSTMAACALVATADGVVEYREEERVSNVMNTLERLRVFDPAEGEELFRDYAEAILGAPKQGHDLAMESVRRSARDPEVAELLIRVCLAVSSSGGEMPLPDQIEIVTLCSRLGVDPGTCGLYTDGSPEDLVTGASPSAA